VWCALGHVFPKITLNMPTLYQIEQNTRGMGKP
jgi:hypothetical protein